MKSRNTLLALTAAGALAIGATGPAAHAEDSSYLTVLATTDVHGRVFDWDYFAESPYQSKPLGLSRVDSIVDSIRAERGAGSVLVADNGDAIQGTPLSYVAAKKPELLGGPDNPMAVAFNEIGFDVMNLGNHEFNYGLDYLNGYISQVEAPMLGGNILKHGTEDSAYAPYVILDKIVDGKTVKVGVLGVDTPGVRNWDKGFVSGVLDFRDCVETAQKQVPLMKAAGAQVIVVLIHSGLDPEGIPWNPAELQENVATSLATHVNDIDVVIAGHSHVTNKDSLVFHAPDGDPVLLSQPHHWAQGVSEVRVPLTWENGAPTIAWPEDDAAIATHARVIATKDYPESADIVDNPTLAEAHKATLKYVNTVVAQSTEEMPTAQSTYRDVPVLDYIAKVQIDTVTEALKGTEHEGTKVITSVSPFSRTAVFPKGKVTIKDIAALYVYENTLRAVKLDGKQIRDYLEWSARYYWQVEEGAEYDVNRGGRAKYDGATRAIPDYGYDSIQGLDYLVDISKPVGQRIIGLSHHDTGAPVADDDQFILAVNNYRQGGGGEYPHVVDAQVVYDEVKEIRQLIIDHALADGVIDPANFYEDNWVLVTKTPKPTLSASKASYAVGDTITLTLAGFLPERETKLSIGGAEPQTFKTDAKGEANVQFQADAAGTVTMSATQTALRAEASIEVVTASEGPVDGGDSGDDGTADGGPADGAPSDGGPGEGEPSDGTPGDGRADSKPDDGTSASRPDGNGAGGPAGDDAGAPAEDAAKDSSTSGGASGPVVKPAPTATPTAPAQTGPLAKTGASTGLSLVAAAASLMAIGAFLRCKAA